MKSTGPPPRSPGSISCKDKRGTLQYRRLRYYIYKCNPGGEISMEATITGDGFNIPERLVSKTPSPESRVHMTVVHKEATQLQSPEAIVQCPNARVQSQGSRDEISIHPQINPKRSFSKSAYLIKFV